MNLSWPSFDEWVAAMAAPFIDHQSLRIGLLVIIALLVGAACSRFGLAEDLEEPGER